MRFSFAMIAAATLGVVAQAASQPPSSAGHPAGLTMASMIRLRGGQPSELPSSRAIFQGSFTSAGGRHYDVTGDGIIQPVNIGGQGALKYRVNLHAFPRDSNAPKVDFGVLEGQGAVNGPSTSDHVSFNILGTPNSDGYRLDLNGFISGDILAGDFRVSGGGGDGQGDFAGRP